MKWTIWTLASMVFLILSLSFYWLGVRPVSIREECVNWATSKSGTIYTAERKRTNNLYRQCLVQHGMSPESIFVNLE